MFDDFASNRRRTVQASLIAIGCAFLAVNVQNASAADEPRGGKCIIIDTDAYVDDLGAIASLAPSKHVVAVVVTEGMARPVEGAGAIEKFLQHIDPDIPVVPGESVDPSRRRLPENMPKSDLEQRREVAESLNGTVRRPLFPHAGFGDLAPTLLELTKDCTRVELLIIGPWTSFMRYAPSLLDKVDAIVAQGRPAPDELDAEPGGFNCTYDRDSCLAAFDMLVGRRVRADRHLRALWMDIPHSPAGFGSAEAGMKSDGSPAYPFSPTIGWLDELKKSGGAAAVFSDVLANQPSSWNDTSLGRAGRTLSSTAGIVREPRWPLGALRSRQHDQKRARGGHGKDQFRTDGRPGLPKP